MTLTKNININIEKLLPGGLTSWNKSRLKPHPASLKQQCFKALQIPLKTLICAGEAKKSHFKHGKKISIIGRHFGVKVQ